MTTKRKWTNEEEQVLISQVRQSPNNLARAFRVTSEVLGRSLRSVTLHWYNKTRHSEAIFMTVGSKTVNMNSKNVFHGSYDNTEKMKVSIWRRFVSFIKSRL